MPMHARITQFKVRLGKLEEMAEALDTLVPMMLQQKGFKSLIVLRGAALPGNTSEAPVITAITTWDSLDSLRASEENLYFYRAMARVLAFSDGFPTIQEHEVLVNEYHPGA
ncbi:MAG: antibiotic biosynthesis monooxygenase [Acidobacteriota bacterium]|nr:antibiotic biosynthesis monooxygenase [Acidobacteriota bacterium]